MTSEVTTGGPRQGPVVREQRRVSPMPPTSGARPRDGRALAALGLVAGIAVPAALLGGPQATALPAPAVSASLAAAAPADVRAVGAANADDEQPVCGDPKAKDFPIEARIQDALGPVRLRRRLRHLVPRPHQHLRHVLPGPAPGSRARRPRPQADVGPDPAGVLRTRQPGEGAPRHLGEHRPRRADRRLRRPVPGFTVPAGRPSPYASGWRSPPTPPPARSPRTRPSSSAATRTRGRAAGARTVSGWGSRRSTPS